MANISLFSESLPLAEKVVLTPTSLELVGVLGAVEQELAWRKLAQVHGGTQWWIGDLADQTDRADIAETQGIGRKTLRQYAWICRNVEPSTRVDALSFKHHELVASMDPAEQRMWLELAERNDWTVAQLRSEINLKKPTETPDLPPGKFNLIYADPPWKYDFSPTSGRKVERHYPTMDLEQILAIRVQDIAYDDCTIFLWGTSPKLPWAFDVLEAWGFDYKTCMVWVKDKIGMGYYARQQHELLLIGGRGNSQLPAPENRPSSIIQSPRTEHSKKPPEVYDLIDSMYPTAAKVELFARNERPGWTGWGNEVRVAA